uniref:Uncharacterized protein n=1 Tax=Magallana gigas TaxID=29159 RepID=A0A8W8KPV4_MAGGI
YSGTSGRKLRDDGLSHGPGQAIYRRGRESSAGSINWIARVQTTPLRVQQPRYEPLGPHGPTSQSDQYVWIMLGYSKLT